MAGYVLKIMLEDTHPPVWRRIIVPERITFEELHEMIQIIFDWDDDHLHDFRIPSKNLCIDNGEDSWNFNHYREDETLLEQIFPANKWIRYTYDFGDEWRHKVIYEKTDLSFEKRHADLLKFKGDHFLEDSGGVWYQDDDENRSPFDWNAVESRLEKLECPVHEGLEVDEDSDFSMKEVDEFLKGVFDKWDKKLDEFIKENKMPKPLSQMTKKIDLWKNFAEEYTEKSKEYVVETVSAGKSNAELLDALGMQEAKDYCKYIQIPVGALWEKKQLTDAIAKTFREHPEYFLYVLHEEEFEELQRWMKSPDYMKRGVIKNTNVLVKAMGLGIMDAAILQKTGKTCAEITFAVDVQELLKPLNKQCCRRVYRELNSFSDKLERYILTYGVLELESFYNMYCSAYKAIEKETFFRYIYWFARFNDYIQTAYSADGVNYIASTQLDLQAIIPNMKKYADDMEYVQYSAEELKRLSEDISQTSEWMDALFTNFLFQLHFSERDSAELVETMFEEVMNGSSVPEVLEEMYNLKPVKNDLSGACELWSCTVGMMLDLGLPMLKGRSRMEYGGEKRISPWETGMLDDEQAVVYTKETHMYEFPKDIQESMFYANNYADNREMNQLFRFKEKNNVKSEEFLFLLTEAYITCGESYGAQKLIRELRRSSARGKAAAARLRERLENGMDVMGEEEVFMPLLWDARKSESPQQPYIRETRKIGRNEPCPCGSGRKYKHCCGKA